MSLAISVKETRKKDNTVVFLIKDSTPAFVNALRRTVMGKVPVMAVDEVAFVQNSSGLFDEVIAHRLGLLPLTTDLKNYVRKDECTCEGAGCARCTVKLSLKVKGPGYVYAEDIKSKDPAVKPAYPKTPITKLLKGQEVEFEATAILGVGNDHVKWSPAHVWHTNEPKLTINAKHPDLKQWIQKYPPHVFKDGKVDKDAIEEHNLYDAVDGVNDDIIKVEYEKNNFLFHVEPFGQLKAKEIMLATIEYLKLQFEILETSAKALE